MTKWKGNSWTIQHAPCCKWAHKWANLNESSWSLRWFSFSIISYERGVYVLTTYSLVITINTLNNNNKLWITGMEKFTKDEKKK